MNDRLENNWSMKLAVETVLAKFESEWTVIPKFKEAVVLFRSKLADIDNDRKVEEKRTGGAADSKTARRIVMCEDAVVVAKIVMVYAVYNNDLVLKDIVDYSYTDLFKVRDTESKIRCNDIYDAAILIEADLIANYGLKAMALPNLNSAITAYENVISAPTTAKGVKLTAGRNVKGLIKETDDILKEKIDKLMGNFKDDSKKFYGEYFISRVIIDLGRRKKAVTDATDKLATLSGKIGDGHGKWFKGVTCILIGAEKNYTVLTDKNGYYIFKGAMDGTYTLQIVLFGKKLIIEENVELKTDDEMVKDYTLEDAENDTVNKPK